MSYFRSYFDKNNTLIKNSRVNTSKNPTTEIFYGSSFSKFIFKVDFTDLKNRVNNGEYVVDSNTKHTLHMTNTIFGDEGLRGQNRSTGRDRTTSFDLILFKITQYWDEGIGFDYENNSYNFVDGERTYDERPSNWFYRTTMNTWQNPGVYGTSPIILGTQHFDNGNENLEIDITSYVNEILNGSVNQGLGIAFALVYQDLQTDTDQSVSFFTKYTQTFYEPFVETYFDDTLSDNRNDFTANKAQNLYLYIYDNGNSINLDNLPTVDIKDSFGNIISGLSDLSAELVRKGVYKVSFGLSGDVCDGKKFYYDAWKNLSLNGISIPDVSQKFIPKPITNSLSIGQNQNLTKRYATQYFGVSMNEKLEIGEKRKVTVNFRNIDNPRTEVLDEVYYKIYILEGHTQVLIHDWTLMDKTSNENYFLLDTSYFIPREYIMEIKGQSFNEEIIYKDPIKFEIVSQR